MQKVATLHPEGLGIGFAILTQKETFSLTVQTFSILL